MIKIYKAQSMSITILSISYFIFVNTLFYDNDQLIMKDSSFDKRHSCTISWFITETVNMRHKLNVKRSITHSKSLTFWNLIDHGILIFNVDTRTWKVSWVRSSNMKQHITRSTNSYIGLRLENTKIGHVVLSARRDAWECLLEIEDVLSISGRIRLWR